MSQKLDIILAENRLLWFDGGLGDVVGEHLNLVVPFDKVECGEQGRAGHIVCEVVNVWTRELVEHHCIVEPAKIPTGAPRTVRHWHHVKDGGPRQITLPNNASFLHPFKLGLRSSVLLHQLSQTSGSCWM